VEAGSKVRLVCVPGQVQVPQRGVAQFHSSPGIMSTLIRIYFTLHTLHKHQEYEENLRRKGALSSSEQDTKKTTSGESLTSGGQDK
jgi:hypothetical protein